jgi:hypothetical protein
MLSGKFLVIVSDDSLTVGDQNLLTSATPRLPANIGSTGEATQWLHLKKHQVNLKQNKDWLLPQSLCLKAAVPSAV